MSVRKKNKVRKLADSFWDKDSELYKFVTKREYIQIFEKAYNIGASTQKVLNTNETPNEN